MIYRNPKKNEKPEQTYKPGSVINEHLSGTLVTKRLVRPYPETERATPCVSLFGLAPSGVYLAN